MYRISELAAQLGLSRTALLYYEKLGLLKGTRSSNGYRLYSERDLQRMRLIQQLQSAGLSLKECKACLDARIERQVLLNRLGQLDAEIVQKQRARDMLAALVGEEGLKGWHESLDRMAPDAHMEWLLSQGFNEKEAIRLKWLSKDMNEHDRYMADFATVFEQLDRWAPGSEAETLKALTQILFSPESILEVGCGNGVATVVLAEHTAANIVAVDNDEAALSRLMEKLVDRGLGHRVTPLCASMTDLPFAPGKFDVVWAEGSAYIMGVDKALRQWRKLLRDNGVLAFSDMVWKVEDPRTAVKAFWEREYPDMTTEAARIAQAEAAGYELLDSFPLGEEAWKAYCLPLKERVEALECEMGDSRALRDIKAELAVCIPDHVEFGYQFLLLSKRG